MAKEANRAFERSGLTSNLLDACDPESGEAIYPEHRDNWEPLSPTEKASDLPRRMWMIVAAAGAAWVAVLAIVYFILG